MFTKIALAIVVAVATASSAFAAPKKYSSNPAHDVFVNGKIVAQKRKRPSCLCTVVTHGTPIQSHHRGEPKTHCLLVPISRFTVVHFSRFFSAVP